MVFDLMGEETIDIKPITPKSEVQVIHMYAEYLLLPSGELRKGTFKTWVKGVKETKKLKSQTLTMPKIELGEEVLL